MRSKYLISTILCCLPLVAGAQGFLGKRVLLDANVYTSSKVVRPFDYNSQFITVPEPDDLFYTTFDSDSYFDEKDCETKSMEGYHLWDCNIFFSASIETILWRKGSLMLEARFVPYSDFFYQDKPLLGFLELNFPLEFNRKAEERSFEAGIGYRQYMFETSNAPYGRYIQVGVNKLQVQWRRNCLDEAARAFIAEKTHIPSQEVFERFSSEKSAGNEYLWAGYLELGYNHLFLNDRLRVSFAMRTEIPFLGKAEEDDLPNVGYYAVRHFWCTNLFSLRAGVGFLLF